MINVTRKQMPTVYKACQRKLMKNAVDDEECWSRSRREPWYIRTQFIHSSKYNWDCRFPWRREPLARDVDKTVKMAEGPRCGAKGEGVPVIGKGAQSSMWSDLRLNSYLWFLYNVKDGKVIDDKSIDQSMESCKSRMLMWSMWSRISKWSRMSRNRMWPKMARTTKYTTWNWTSVWKKLFIKITYTTVLKTWILNISEIHLLLLFYLTDRVNNSGSLGRRGNMLYNIHLMVYKGVIYNWVSSHSEWPDTLCVSWYEPYINDAIV